MRALTQGNDRMSLAFVRTYLHAYAICKDHKATCFWMCVNSSTLNTFMEQRQEIILSITYIFFNTHVYIRLMSLLLSDADSAFFKALFFPFLQSA